MQEDDLFEIINRQIPKSRLALIAAQNMNVTYDDFIDLLYSDIERHLRILENDCDQLANLDEDSLTGNLTRMLNASCTFQATNQTKQGGGAADLVVTFQGHQWVAEAKKLTSFDKAFEGFLQLTTRYIRQDTHAGILLYATTGNFAKKKAGWKTYLSKGGEHQKYISTNKQPEYHEKLFELISNHAFTDDGNYFTDSQLEMQRGFPLNLRHFFCNFIYEPMDTSGVKAAKHRKAQALEALEEIYERSTEATPKDINLGDVERALSLLFRELTKNKKKSSKS